MRMLDIALFVLFPYLAVAFAVAIGIYRAVRDKTAFSSFSSQFLEKELLYRGSVGWHYGILIVLIAHGVALIFPRLWRIFGGSPLRLWGMEISGIALALLALTGLVVLMVRRIVVARVRQVTTSMDWALEIALFAEVGMGFLVALTYRWGSQWYLSTAVPWIVSLLTLRPDPTYITSLPWLVKLHFFGAFVLIGLFPFGRLLHLATSRLSYLFRPYQVVIWQSRNRRGKNRA
jgi:nitrate reductase gamma subunit